MLYRLFLGLMILCLLWVGNIQAAPVVIKFSHVLDEDTPKGFLAETFKKEMEKRLPGEVKVEVYHRGELYNDSDVIAAVISNEVQLASPAISKFTPYTRKLEVFDLPFLFDDLKAAQTFQATEQGQALLLHMRNQGLLGLGYLHNGMKQLLSQRELKRPEDAVGMSFRVMPSDVLVAQFEVIGAKGLKAAFPKVPELMAEGRIQGHESSWSLIYSHKLYALQPYITSSNHGYIGNMVITSPKFWESLPDKVRKEAEKVLKMAITKANTMAYLKTANDRFKVINSEGVKVVAITKDERRRWIEVMRPVWQRFSDDIGSDVIDAAEAANQR